MHMTLVEASRSLAQAASARKQGEGAQPRKQGGLLLHQQLRVAWAQPSKLQGSGGGGQH
jgi:hypothetical protein